jgi:hypothetical protein
MDMDMDSIEEIFKPIDGYKDYYISNQGNVKNNKTNRLLKIQKSSGYSMVGLNNIKKRNSFLIHRLVAKAFISNPENKLTVNHINHDTHDNRVENLEWNTQKEQNEHNYNTESEKRKTNRARSVICFDKITNHKTKEFRSLSEASKWLNEESNSNNVESCLAGIRGSLINGWACKGYLWKYNDLENADLEGEIWKEIPEEFTCGKRNYWISNKGRFKNDRDKIVELKNHHQYITISFRNKNNKSTYQLHRIVAQLFVDNSDNKPFVNHIDGNKDNNFADNLEWVTKSENTKHAHDNGLIKKNSRIVNQYDKEGNFIQQFESIKDAGIKLKLDKSSIGHICAKDRPGSNTCGGFVFKYANQDENIKLSNKI